MAKLSGPMSAALFEIRSGQTLTAGKSTLKALETRGLIIDIGDGKYALTVSGIDVTEAVYGPAEEVSVSESLAEAAEAITADETALVLGPDPIVSVRMNRKDRRDMGRQARVESRQAAKAQDQRIKRWGHTYRPAKVA